MTKEKLTQIIAEALNEIKQKTIEKKITEDLSFKFTNDLNYRDAIGKIIAGSIATDRSLILANPVTVLGLIDACCIFAFAIGRKLGQAEIIDLETERIMKSNAADIQ